MLDMSQSEFGEAVGVSGKTIQQIENGLLKISPGLAQKISLDFGLDPDQLITGDDPERPRMVSQELPFTTEIRFFTRAGYELHRKPHRDIPRRELDRHVLNFTFGLEVLLDAANHSGRYGPFAFTLMKKLTAFAEESGLLNAIERILTDYGAPPGMHYDLTTNLFAGPQITGMLENRDRMRPWLYGELPKEDKPSVPPTGNMGVVINVIDLPTFTAEKQASEQSSPKGKSPRKHELPLPPRDRGSAARRPSGSRRGRAPG